MVSEACVEGRFGNNVKEDDVEVGSAKDEILHL